MSNAIPTYLIKCNTSDFKDSFETAADFFLAPVRNMCGYKVTKYTNGHQDYYGTLQSHTTDIISRIAWAILTVLSAPFILIGLLLNNSSTTHNQHLIQQQHDEAEASSWTSCRKVLHLAQDEGRQDIIDIFEQYNISQRGLDTIGIADVHNDSAAYISLVNYAYKNNLEVLNDQFSKVLYHAYKDARQDIIDIFTRNNLFGVRSNYLAVSNVRDFEDYSAFVKFAYKNNLEVLRYSFEKLTFFARDESQQEISNFLHELGLQFAQCDQVPVGQINKNARVHSMLVRFAEAHGLAIVKKQDSRQVGSLASQWQWPSDHIPVGVIMDGYGIASFNVLNTLYMHFVETSDTQGLKGSQITAENRPADQMFSKTGKPETVRDHSVAVIVAQMISHPTHPKSVIALQECSQEFIDTLKHFLPSHFMYVASISKKGNMNVLLFNNQSFEYVNSDSSFNFLSDGSKNKPLLEVTLRSRATDETYQFFNVHIPGNPNDKSGLQELAGYAKARKDQASKTIILGDFNFDEDEVRNGFQHPIVAGQPLEPVSDEVLRQNLEFWAGHYNTIVQPLQTGRQLRDTKNIDHIVVFGEKKPVICDLTPEDVAQGTQRLVDLL